MGLVGPGPIGPIYLLGPVGPCWGHSCVGPCWGHSFVGPCWGHSFIGHVGPILISISKTNLKQVGSILGFHLLGPVAPGPCWASFVGPCWTKSPVEAIHLLGPVGTIHLLDHVGPILISIPTTNIKQII